MRQRLESLSRLLAVTAVCWPLQPCQVACPPGSANVRRTNRVSLNVFTTLTCLFWIKAGDCSANAICQTKSILFTAMIELDREIYMDSSRVSPQRHLSPCRKEVSWGLTKTCQNTSKRVSVHGGDGPAATNMKVKAFGRVVLSSTLLFASPSSNIFPATQDERVPRQEHASLAEERDSIPVHPQVLGLLDSLVQRQNTITATNARTATNAVA